MTLIIYTAKQKHDKLQNRAQITQTKKNMYFMCFILLVGGISTLVTFYTTLLFISFLEISFEMKLTLERLPIKWFRELKGLST